MKGLLGLIFLCGFNYCFGQNLSGQWRGSFNTAGNVVAKDGDTEYVLELDIHGGDITGFSYSYFNYPEKRYYVICRLEGKYNPSDKSIVVNEEERIKGNTPPGWSDCLQTHILTFLKQGNTEKLVGRWRGYLPSSGCGAGSTELERKMLTKVAPPKASPPVAKKTTAPVKKPTAVTKPIAAPPVAKKPVQKPTPLTAKKPAKTSVATNKKPLPDQQTITQNTEKTIRDSAVKSSVPEVITLSVPGFEKRVKNILKTIEIPAGEEISVDLYDNGEIDGDTISVFYNNQLVLSSQRLTDKPLSIKIKLDPNREDNELVMYADNMGSIPPNTALMIATIEGKRYEVYITSTEKSSGAIRFKKKE